MAGTAFGTVAHSAFPTVTESAGAYGLIGMGAALGGATGAPITAVVILFELTGEYSIILPLMAAVVMAAGTGHLLSRDTIYTAKLWRRGVDLDRPAATLPSFTAADIARPAPDPLPHRATLASAATALAGTTLGIVPVVGAEGDYRGCLTAQDVTQALDDPDPPERVTDLIHRPTALAADTPPHEILSALAGHGATGLPVLDRDGTALLGWITYETVLARMHPEISTGSDDAP